MTAITLLTDFGTQDTFIGQMKGVIHAIAPEARVIDLTHHIRAQDIVHAAVMLDASVDAFAPDTIHLAVVDPGVGSSRRAIAIQTETGTFVGPDNGLFSPVLASRDIRRIVVLDNTVYHRDHVSATFHGRDVFAPVAAHLAAGTPLYVMGQTVDNYERLALPQPQIDATEITAHVLYADAFGNLITDLTRSAFQQWAPTADPARLRLQLADHTLTGLSRTYNDVAPGEPLAYFGSSERLEIAIRQGSAASQWPVSPGMTARLTLQ